MTQEEKARAYDEVRKKIAIRFGSNVADEIFSQFEMSEDEKIRKGLIGYFLAGKCENISSYHGIPTNDILSWLRRQCTDISSFSKEQQKYMKKYLSLDKITLIKLLAERDRNVEEITESFEKQEKEK